VTWQEIRPEEIDDHHAWELECLREVCAGWESGDEHLERWMAETGRRFISAELQGEYPDTLLYVHLEDRRRTPPERHVPYGLWSETFQSWGPNNELQQTPSYAAANIFMWTMEH
jgi:hypothetical protein